MRPIYGPTLDGTLPGNEVIVQSRNADRVTYARAMGPMQFLPGTWSRYASDGDGDGIPDYQDSCPTVPAPGTADGCPPKVVEPEPAPAVEPAAPRRATQPRECPA